MSGLIYTLDTNIISELTKETPDEKVITMLEAKAMFCCISAPVWYEILKGIHLMPESKKKRMAEYFAYEYLQKNFKILPYDEHAANLNAQVYADLKKDGLTPPLMDSQIASIAMANNMVLVTRNVKDYKSISEHFSLCIENWFE